MSIQPCYASRTLPLAMIHPSVCGWTHRGRDMPCGREYRIAGGVSRHLEKATEHNLRMKRVGALCVLMLLRKRTEHMVPHNN